MNTEPNKIRPKQIYTAVITVNLSIMEITGCKPYLIYTLSRYYFSLWDELRISMWLKYAVELLLTTK